MKIAGKTINALNEEIVVIPRKSGNIVFHCRAVLSFDKYEQLNPAPQPRMGTRPGGETFLLIEEPAFKEALDKWASLKFAWMVIESLKATPDIEFDTIKYDDPNTFANYLTELRSANLAETEIGRILETVSSVCGLNQKKIDEATAAFLAGQGAE